MLTSWSIDSAIRSTLTLWWTHHHQPPQTSINENFLSTTIAVYRGQTQVVDTLLDCLIYCICLLSRMEVYKWEWEDVLPCKLLRLICRENPGTHCTQFFSLLPRQMKTMAKVHLNKSKAWHMPFFLLLLIREHFLGMSHRNSPWLC